MTLSYSASLKFLYGLQKHGIKLGLDTVERLLTRLGGPHRQYPSLHIGGTNGKGSTAAMAASILQAAGFRVGLYTSPHLVDFRERIRIDEQPIPEAALVDLTERLRVALPDDLEPTFFEFTTVLAFEYFAESKIDVAVVEVGMGGRFDATNVVTPLATAITNVTLDHEAYLGRTIAAIAGEKAGIVKHGVPVVAGRLTEEAWAVVADVAQRREAPVLRWARDFHAAGDPIRGFTYRGRTRAYPDLSCPLPGRHQLENAGCALALLEAAGERGLVVREEAVRHGLRSVRWGGRLEVVERAPLLVLDGAHNPGAAAVVADYLAEHRRSASEARIILVTAMMRDKDRAGFFGAVLPVVDEVILTAVAMPRAATVAELSDALGGWPGPVHRAETAAHALSEARRLATPRDMICVTGSLMLVGEVKALLRGCEVSLLRG
ncbi:bifunctional folylpolyglutamate synthase/dihydrofolate synthase [Candidatus Nitrospira bockiana]